MNRRQLLALLSLPPALGPVLATSTTSSGPSAPAARQALIVGNSRYAGAPLANPAHDARLVARTVRELGYQTRLQLEATLPTLVDEVKAWLASAASADVRLMYFAGHGAQYRGRNYLIPVDAELQSEDELPAKAFNVNDLTDRLSRFPTGVNIIVLDACRSVPWAASGGRVRSRGLEAPQAGLSPTLAPRGTLIAYATSPGAVAADGPQVANSVYTAQLATHMREPGLPIEAVFKRTRAAVMQASQGAQTPWETSSLVGEFCFATGANGECGGSPEGGRVLDLRKR